MWLYRLSRLASESPEMQSGIALSGKSHETVVSPALPCDTKNKR